jgi:hypothetical protein
MKFVTVEPQFHRVTLGDFADLHSAERAIGLEPLKTDHGVVMRTEERAIGIVIFEFAFFVPPEQQFYFAIEHRLYAGNCVLYAFNPQGETIDFDPPLPFFRWFDDNIDVEAAILQGSVARPQLKLNDQLIWSWPEEMPRQFRVML